MGTASTITTLTEALGMTLPGASTIPAVDSAHPRLAAACGERIVEMVWQDYKPSRFITKDSFHNAIVTYMAIGGSTNAAIHLVAIAGRMGIKLTLDEMDALSSKVPVIVDMMPAGRFLMEDLHYAGGITALLSRLNGYLRMECLTVNGHTLGDNIAYAKVYNEEVIRPLSRPVTDGSSLAVLRGNIAPGGAVIKPSAASPKLMRSRGRALVFANHAEMTSRIDDPQLDVDENTVLVLQGAGPVGAPGMPEWGRATHPQKALAAGRARHGTNLRCPHERHTLRHCGAARLSRSCRRRTPGFGAHWGHDFPGCSSSHPHHGGG